MNNKYKYLLWSGTAALIALIIFILALTDKISDTTATTNTVSFSGEGKILTKPDVAIISLSIVTESISSKEAQNENSKKSKALVDFLKKEDVAEKDIKTTSYNIYPQYKYPQYDKPEIRGYAVTESLEVKIRNLDKVSSILDGVVTAGVNQVNNLQFSVDEPEKLRAEAREKAIEDAKEKAEELEDQLGIDLGKIVNFSENTGGFIPPIIYSAEKDGQGGFGGGGPELPGGENEIVVNVMITYQIK